MKFGLASSLRLDARAAKAEILLYDVIGRGGILSRAVSASDVMKALAEAKDAKEIVVRINSPGGEVFEGVAIYNALKRHPAKKTVHIDGVAASMASFVAMAADRICIAANARVMIHEPRLMDVEGTADELDGMVQNMRTVRQMMAETYAARTKQSVEAITAWMAEEKWFSAAEAKECGFADEVTGELRMAALAGPSLEMLAQFKHAPDDLRASARPKEKTMADVSAVSKTILTHLALTETASEAEAVTALSKLVENVKAFVAISGKENPEDALGVLRGWQEAAKQHQAILDELTKLKADAQAREVDALIADAKREGRLPPAAEKSAREIGAQNVSALKSFLEVLPKIGGPRLEATVRQGLVRASEIPIESVVLTPDEERMVASHSRDPKKQTEFRGQMLARKKERIAALATQENAA